MLILNSRGIIVSDEVRDRIPRCLLDQLVSEDELIDRALAVSSADDLLADIASPPS